MNTHDLPNINFRYIGVHDDELFFEDDRVLESVLHQQNPVYLALDMPGLITTPLVCFPTTCKTRIYSKNVIDEKTLIATHETYRSYKVPKLLEYRFGMKMLPWMFFSLLNNEIHKARAKRDNIVNYIVFNSFGYGGVLIRVSRKHATNYSTGDWLEIYHIQLGNQYHVPKWRQDPNTRLLARFLPHYSSGRGWIWKAEDLRAIALA
jgi:hypothetical protein